MKNLTKEYIEWFKKHHILMIKWNRRIGGHTDDYYYKKVLNLIKKRPKMYE